MMSKNICLYFIWTNKGIISTRNILHNKMESGHKQIAYGKKK